MPEIGRLVGVLIRLLGSAISSDQGHAILYLNYLAALAPHSTPAPTHRKPRCTLA